MPTDDDLSPRPPMPLTQAAESALRLIRLAEEDLASIKRGMHHAGNDLERAIGAHSREAARDLRKIVLTALGPDLKYGDVIAARRALELVLECLDLPSPGVGGAA